MHDWKNKKYTLAVTTRPVDQADLKEAACITPFKNRELTMRELLGLIRKGRGFCTAELDDVYPTADNFKATQILSVEFNDGRAIEDVLEVPFVKAHATMVYTTEGHTKRAPRFCVLFGMERPSRHWWRTTSATQGLISFLKRKEVFDIHRMQIHAGSVDCEAYIFDQGITGGHVLRLNDKFGWDYENWRDAKTEIAPHPLDSLFVA